PTTAICPLSLHDALPISVKLKDFPWNGWLSLGINAQPSAAWNPIVGFNDPFGRLVWFALADPAVLPAPNDSRWTINRIADVQSRDRKSTRLNSSHVAISY